MTALGGRAAAAVRRACGLACLLSVTAAGSACNEGELGSVKVGDRAPVFELLDLRGARTSLRDVNQRGQTLVNFWASWCAPCKAEVPILNEVHRQLKDTGLTIVGISSEEPPEPVAAFVRKYQIEYPVLLDSDGRISMRYGLIGLPMNVLVDKNGVVTMVKFGAIDEEMMAALGAKGIAIEQ